MPVTMRALHPRTAVVRAVWPLGSEQRASPPPPRCDRSGTRQEPYGGCPGCPPNAAEHTVRIGSLLIALLCLLLVRLTQNQKRSLLTHFLRGCFAKAAR